MNKLLIPIDFSAASAQVLTYVAGLTQAIDIKEIILLKSAYNTIYSQLLQSADYLELNPEIWEQERKDVQQRTEAICKEFARTLKPGIKVNVGISEQPLLRAIHDMLAQEQPNLLIVNSDGTDTTADNIGTQVIQIVKTSPVPVMVIPRNTVFEHVKKALVPVDFKALERLNILKDLLPFSHDVKPELILLNVNAGAVSATVDTETEKALAAILTDYKYSVQVSANKDALQGILDFTTQNEQQLIVALPGKYSFFYNLTHRSITHALALYAKHPVLVLK